MARLESARRDDRTSALSAAIYGRRGRESVGCARSLFGQHPLSHSRDQPAFYDWHVRFVRLYSAHQRRCYRSLWPGSDRYACHRAPRPTTCTRECRVSCGVWRRVRWRPAASVDRPLDSAGALQSSCPASGAVGRTSSGRAHQQAEQRHPPQASPRRRSQGRPPALRRRGQSAEAQFLIENALRDEADALALADRKHPIA